MSHVLGIFPVPEKAELSWISLQDYYYYCYYNIHIAHLNGRAQA
jgi:hypothetical protein